MTPFDELVLTLTLPRVRARERLEDPERCGRLSMEQLHDLAVAAGYTEEQASEMAGARGWQRLSAGIRM